MGELCPVKTEDVWLRGDSSNSKWLPFYKLGLCNKMRRGEYYQFRRPVKIAFLKPRRGWSLSREEPESVFLTASPGGRGVWDLFACMSVCMCVCVSLFHWERHPLRPFVPAGPAVTPPRSIFSHPQTERHARVCVHAQEHIDMKSLICANKHTLSLGQRTIRLEMKFCVKLCVCVNVCVNASFYTMSVCQPEILC